MGHTRIGCNASYSLCTIYLNKLHGIQSNITTLLQRLFVKQGLMASSLISDRHSPTNFRLTPMRRSLIVQIKLHEPRPRVAMITNNAVPKRSFCQASFSSHLLSASVCLLQILLRSSQSCLLLSLFLLLDDNPDCLVLVSLTVSQVR
jgi:hypothetical protein